MNNLLLTGLPPEKSSLSPEPAGRLRKPGGVAGNAEEHVAEQFEALLVTQLLRASKTEEGGWLGTGDDATASSAIGMAEELFAQSLAAQGGLGLARMIRAGLTRPGGPGRAK